MQYRHDPPSKPLERSLGTANPGVRIGEAIIGEAITDGHAEPSDQVQYGMNEED